MGMTEPVLAQKNQHWRVLKKYLQKEIVVISSDKSMLIISHPTNKDTIRIGLDPCADCDIIGKIERNRGDNPYRVWLANDTFWKNEARPKSTWGHYFRASFLRILRPPPESK